MTEPEPRALDARRPPLADRLRPRNLDEFVGQEHIVGPGRLLRRAIQADRLSSVIFFGPPGTGKTTLARVVANTTSAHFIALNAVLAGVKDIRAAVAEAEARREGLFGQRTLLFVDEVHRFNKAQQDALLPWVENGTITLIGATTENPFFEVNKALVSRSRIFQLEPLEARHLRAVVQSALADVERGYGRLDVRIDEDALEHLVNVANGDARALLNALELAVETTPSPVHIDLTVAEESIQRRAVLYDKEGDAHYDTISAFIKSVRGSDPDASLYWLARMVYAGEDPRFILRRLIILAGEDIGLADPSAMGVVMACAQAFEWVGLPEGQFHLTEATLYLANAPKSNSALAYFDALEAVKAERSGDVPDSLKDGNRDRESLGHGAGYRYPHAYKDHWVAQQYLPDGLRGRVFYRPADQGWEGRRRVEVLARREAQLAAMLEDEIETSTAGNLTWTGPHVPGVAARDRWLTRAVGRSGQRLGVLRDRVLDVAAPTRGDRVLDLAAGAGLLTWPALRAAPEGGVWALVAGAEQAAALRDVATTLAEQGGADEAGRATHEGALVVLEGAIEELPQLLAARGEGDVRFEVIIGRDALGALPDPKARRRAAEAMAAVLAPGGRIVLVETVPAESSRPSEWLTSASVDVGRSSDNGRFAGDDGEEGAADEVAERAAGRIEGDERANGRGSVDGGDSDGGSDDLLVHRLAEAESAWLERDARFGWRPEDMAELLCRGGLSGTVGERLRHEGRVQPSATLIDRWLEDGPLAAALAEALTADDRAALRRRFDALVGGRALPWRFVAALLLARDAEYASVHPDVLSNRRREREADDEGDRDFHG